MNFNCDKRIAFTLAEILVTLGVIGVIAAMTIPALITKYQQMYTVNHLKKAFADFSNAMRLSEAENGEWINWVDLTNQADVFDKYFFPYLKGSKKTATTNKLVYYTPGGRRETGLWVLRSTCNVYTLLNGTQMIIAKRSAYSNESVIGFLIDINGYESKPNKFGRDAFYFLLAKKGGVLIFSTDDGEDHSTVTRNRTQLKNGPSRFQYQCNKQSRGMWCGALIRADGWKINKDYPW